MLCDSYDKQFYDSERNGKCYLIHARCVIIILKHCSFFIFLWIKIITVLPIRKKEIPCYAFISILWDNAILYRLLFLIRLYKGYLLHSIFFGQAFNEKSIKTYFSNLGCCVLTMHPIPVLILKLIFSLIKDLKLKILYLSSLLPLYVCSQCLQSAGACLLLLLKSDYKSHDEIFYNSFYLWNPQFQYIELGLCVYFSSPALKCLWVSNIRFQISFNLDFSLKVIWGFTQEEFPY